MEPQSVPDRAPSSVDTLPRMAALPGGASGGSSPGAGRACISVMGTRRCGCMACVCWGASRADAMLAMMASKLRRSMSFDHTESAPACTGQRLPRHCDVQCMRYGVPLN